MSGAPMRWRFAAAVTAVALVAITLRVLLTVAYSPAILSFPDEASYVGAAAGKLFSNPFRPAGYALFLRVVHLFSANLEFTIAVQHLIGLGTAIAVYAIARRIGAGRWVALFPAAVVALSGDQLYLEHVLLSDGLFVTVLVLTCYCALQATAALEASASGRASVTTRGPGRTALGWSLAAGALVATLAATRTIGVLFGGVLVVWLLAAAGLGWRRRLGTAVPAALLCAALLFGYAFAQQRQTGAFGLSRFSGWPLYSRVATFADCRRFTPPAGTAGLCQSIPSSRRPGPGAYTWTSQSPAVRLFGLPPSGGGKLAAFARAAILAQPGDYLFVVGRDFVRYIDPAIVPGPWWGTTEQTLGLDSISPSSEATNLPAVRAYFHPFQPVRLRRGIAGALESWRGIVRIHGWMIGLGILLAISGMILAPDRATRRGLALLLFGGLALTVGSVALIGYSFRYGIPSGVLLIIAGARGAEVLGLRLGSALVTHVRSPLA